MTSTTEQIRAINGDVITVTRYFYGGALVRKEYARG